MKKTNFTRGSTLPETAFTMSMVLLIFLGLIKLAYIGYEQSESDAAAFVTAHAGSMIPVPGETQVAHAKAKAQAAFPRFPANNIALATSIPSLTQNGDVVGFAHRTAGGLFLTQGFGGSLFDLHSHIVEPTVIAMGTMASNLTVNLASPPNCTNNNEATPKCDGVNLTAPDPSNTSDPYFPYSCRAAYYAVLSNSSGFPPDPQEYFAPQLMDFSTQYGATDYTLPDASSLSSLTDQNGAPLAQHPWPRDFQPNATNGINNTGVRASGWYLTPQTEPNGLPDPANTDGKAKGGTLGTALIPIFNFGSDTSKC